jgi:hypothetical protein
MFCRPSPVAGRWPLVAASEPFQVVVRENPRHLGLFHFRAARLRRGAGGLVEHGAPQRQVAQKGQRRVAGRQRGFADASAALLQLVNRQVDAELLDLSLACSGSV